LSLIILDARQSPQINRIELYRANVQEIKVEIVRDLGDDLRFSDATRAPDMQRHTFADQRMKRLIQFGWFHSDSPLAEYWFGCEEWPVGHLFGDALDCRAAALGRNSDGDIN
jgi:hypothetical protein